MMGPRSRFAGRSRCLAWLVVGVALLAVAAPASGAARAGDERITAYDVVLQVEPAGTLLVTETIDYDFGSANRHGIYRDVPVRRAYDGRYDRIYPLKVRFVDASAGTPHGYELEDVGHSKRIKIGDPDKTISGAHRYTIEYRVSAALDALDDHDELNWNAIGTEWSVPIDRATVRVTAPSAVTAVACYGGGRGSRLACSEATRAGNLAGFSQGGLRAGQGVTVVVAFAKGAVPPPAPLLDERWSATRAFSATPATVGVSALLLAAVLFGLVRAWTAGRDRRFAGSPVDVAFATGGPEEVVRPSLRRFGGEETPVEFAPPDNLRPGQIGTLVDEKANTLDVTATIVDLAVRGHLRIDEVAEKRGWFGKADWKLTKLKPSTDLRDYERSLLDSLFTTGAEVKLSELRNTFADRMHAVQDLLYDDVVAQGWFASRPDKMRRRWQIIGAVASVVSLGLVVLFAAISTAGLVPVPLFVGSILLLAGANRMPRRTAKGTGVMRRCEGFRRFIDESEKERARFAEQQHLFSEYLPYAIVFGATDKWARAFAGLEGQLAEPSWYGGSGSFTPMGFSHSIDGFAVTTSGTITSTPSSSGSGGSGGGGGGGGGGSW